KMELGQWKLPVRLGYPINTPYDDMFFAGTASGKYAYIASNREGGKGGLDIYKVTFLGPQKAPLIDTEDMLLASIAKPVKDDFVPKEVKVERKSLTVFKGKVIDELTRKPIEAEIDITDNKTGQVISTLNSNSASGKFLMSLPSGKNYGIAVKKEGYLFHSENFNLPSGSDFSLVNKNIELKNIKIGSKIALRNVFFASGKSEITSESNAELNRLVKFLKSVPDLKIELGGHTDNVGSKASNTTLSQRRADSVVKYLTSKGITADRLAAKGYGPSDPVDTNDTDEGRQNNRRTEFMITAN
ncbi:MAG: OmpA family protein, partial [Flavobacteriales bacterium]|nr:OmpA family protein [Flavobacteriales bacterium]